MSQAGVRGGTPCVDGLVIRNIFGGADEELAELVKPARGLLVGSS
jgi:hypothetical protein